MPSRRVTAMSVTMLLICLVGCPVAAQDDMTGRFCRLVDEGRDVEAMDLLCTLDSPPMVCGQSEIEEYPLAVMKLWSRRYQSVFQSPANAEALLSDGWRTFHPTRGGYNRNGVASIQGEKTRYFPWDGTVEQLQGAHENPPQNCYLILKGAVDPSLTIDFDLDGEPEITFSGGAPLVADGFQVVEEVAGDTQRFQWLISEGETSPRERARVWLYRDSCYCRVYVDIDGDGTGDCGAGFVLGS